MVDIRAIFQYDGGMEANRSIYGTWMKKLTRPIGILAAILLFFPAPRFADQTGTVPFPELAEGVQAQVIYTGHSGWLVRTRQHVLIFDYTDAAGSRSGRRENSDLDKGHIAAPDLAAYQVVVFISHSHGDHFDPSILDWHTHIPDLTYVLGWKYQPRSEKMICLHERGHYRVAGIEVYSIHHRFDGIPEAAFLVQADGLWIYHSGDHGSTRSPINPLFKENILYLSGYTKQVDLLFVSIFCNRDGSWVNPGDRFSFKKFKPRLILPMHSGGREKEYGEYTQACRENGIKSEVWAARYRGDRFLYGGGKIIVAPESKDR